MSLQLRYANVLGTLLLLAFLAAAACGGEEDAGKSTVREAVPVEPTGTAEYGPVEESGPKEEGEPRMELASVSVPAEPEVAEPVRPVTYEEAEGVYFEGRYEDAVDRFESYTTLRPENPWGHYMLGLSSWKAGDPGAAEAAFRRALELDPEHVKSRLNLARALLDQDRPDDALESVERALELDPGLGVGYRLLGRVRSELGQPGAAISAYRQALQLDDEDVWSMNNLGLIYIRAGCFEDALGPLARAVEVRDDVAIFQNNLGIALERTGHYSAAADAFRRALELEDGYEKASLSLSRVEGREDESPVDLGALAQSFEQEVDRWRGVEPEAPNVQVDTSRVAPDPEPALTEPIPEFGDDAGDETR